ncbi:P-loop NTPase fold protein [Bacillus paramycoides]|uniref:KAP family P-loop NTPase fold protein n=1 Tax=Bacillus paramycoides TaxID=2026194 RepID=UPI002E24BE87|nr:P-loop NTPase fold protein [Bacillus paramycoides]
MIETSSRKTSIVDVPRLGTDGNDYFGIDNYSNSLAEFIKFSNTPITIAIQGEWGSGKTSLMNNVNEQLCDSPGDFYSVRINTWEYSLLTHERKTLVNVVTKMLDETVKVIEGTSAKNTATEQLSLDLEEGIEKKEKFLNKSLRGIKSASKSLKDNTPAILNMLLQLGIQTGMQKGVETLGFDPSMISTMNLNPISKTEEQFIEQKQEELTGNSASVININELKKDIRDAINKFLEINKDKRGFIFFIDDLDRLEPSVAVDILEVLKNIFTIENCIFILAIDYEVIVKGLQAKFGERSDTNEREFRSFFDKIIQVPFTMPVSSYKIDNFLIDKLTDIRYFENKNLDIDNFIPKIREIVELSVGQNPRSLIRLINSLSLNKIINDNISKSMNTEYEEVLHIALVCLQTAFPKIYDLLKYEPSFENWNEDELMHFNNYMYTVNFDNVPKLGYTEEKWQKVLYKICENDSYLNGEFTKIVEIMKKIIEVVPEDIDLGQVITKMLTKSAVTDLSKNSESNAIKIGEYVKTTFEKLVNSSVISPAIIQNLLDLDYSKDTFGLNYPFLKEIDDTTSISLQVKINGNNRYWVKTFEIEGKGYLVCSQWYKNMSTEFERWVKLFNNKNITGQDTSENNSYLTGYNVNLDNNFMYVWAVRTDKNKYINREITIINSSDIEKVESIVTTEDLQEELIRGRLPLLFEEYLVPIKAFDKSYIRIFSPTSNPLLAVAYEIEDKLKVGIIHRIAWELSIIPTADKGESIKRIYKIIKKVLEENRRNYTNLVEQYEEKINSIFNNQEI